MSKRFVPLTVSSLAKSQPGSASCDATRHEPKPDPGFHPLNQPATCPNPNPNGAHAAEPKVTCEREGDRITRIQIVCSCGNVIELACEY
jgi:hypothetical protein